MKKGFTLLEIIIYMGIFSMLLLILVQIFGVSLDILGESQAKATVDQDSEYISLRLEYDTKKAELITVPKELGEVSDTLQIKINGENYTYFLSDGKLKLSNKEGINNLNGFDTIISDLEFKKIGYEGGKDTVLVSFKINSLSLYRGKKETRSFQTTFGLR